MAIKPGSFYQSLYGNATPGSFYNSLYGKKKKEDDKTTQYMDIAKKAGLGQEAEKIVNKKKPNRFAQIMDLLSRGTYTSANIAKTLTDKKADSALDVLKAGWRGLKGQDKTTYAEVLDQAGVKNKYAKAIGGFAGDVLLDPTTYVGGVLAKGGIKVAKGAGKVATKIPVVGGVLEKVGTPVREAVGKAFVPGHGASEGLLDILGTTKNRLAKAKKGIAESAITRYKNVNPEEEGKMFKALTTARVEELANRKTVKQEPKYGTVERFIKEHGAPEKQAKHNLDATQLTGLYYQTKGLVDKANKFDPVFKKTLDDIAQKNGWRIEHGPVKGIDRSLEKTVYENGGDLTKLRDLNRSTVLVNDSSDVKRIADQLRSHFGIERVKDDFGLPSGEYKKANINVDLPYGGKGEIQVTTPEMLRAKMELGGHQLYEQVRSQSPGWEKALEEMRTLYADADRLAIKRLNSASETSWPSTAALNGEYGMPRSVYPATSSPSLTTLTGKSSTSKYMGYDNGINSPFVSSVAETNANVKPSLQSITSELTPKEFKSLHAKPTGLAEFVSENNDRARALGLLDETGKPTSVFDELSKELVDPKKVYAPDFHPMSTKTPTARTLYKDKYIQGTYKGKPYTTDSYMLEFDKVPSPSKTPGMYKVGKEAPSSAAIESIYPKNAKTEVVPYSFKSFGQNGGLVLKGGDAVNVVDPTYYNYFKKKYPGSQFFSSGEAEGKLLVRQNGKDVGLLMPLRVDEDVLKKIEPELGVRIAPKTKVIGKPIEEIDRYKGVDDPRGQVVYHGSNTEFRVPKSPEGRGFSTTTDPQIAKRFGKSVGEYRVSQDAKVLNVLDVPELLGIKEPTSLDKAAGLKIGMKNIKDGERRIATYAKERGYDAIDFRGLDNLMGKTSGYEQEIKILNPDILESTTKNIGVVPKGTGLSSSPVIEENFGQKAIGLAGGYGVSPEGQKVMEAQLARNQKFAKIAGVEQPYESYFPYIKADNLKQVEQATGSLKVGSKGYLKEFAAKLQPDEIINSVPEAYARREYQIVRDRVTSDTLKSIVGKFGKEFESADDALKAGYVPLREKGQFGEILGYVSKRDKDLIDNAFYPEFATIDKLAKATGFDAFNRLWKTAVTKYFPAFHVRNWASGVVQNYEVIGKDALNPVIHANANKVMRKLAGKTTDDTIKLGEQSYRVGDLARAFEDRFGKGDWKHIADIGDTIAEGRADLTLKNYVSKATDKLDYGSAIGKWTETQQKMVAYLAGLKQGKPIDQALKLAEEAGFDYSKVTPFEAKVLRRIIPFYTFARKNLELQGKTLARNPERLATINKLFGAGSVALSGQPASAEEQAGLPDYVTQGLNIRTSKTDEYGRPLYVTAGGTAPEAAAQQLTGNVPLRIISQMNPVLKYIFEKSTGIDTFRSSSGEMTKISDVNNADKYGNAPKFLKDWLGMKEVKKANYVNNKKVGTRTGYTANPDRLKLLENLPTSRIVSTALSVNDLVKGKSITGKKRNQLVLDLLTGVKQYPVDVEQETYFKNLTQQRELEDLLTRYGITKKFETTYVPKK